jgi:methionine synthase II (cobalamin-independent)
LRERFTGDGWPCLIGSLPMQDHAEAARAVVEFTPEIPLWAQLTRRPGEDMISQFASGLPGLRTVDGKRRVDTEAPDFDAELLAFFEEFLAVQEGRRGLEISRFALDRAAVPGLFAMLALAAERPKPPKALKGQITGPFTLGTGLRDGRDRAIFHDPQLREALVNLIALRARWQVRRIAQAGSPVILFIDEPALAGFGSSEYISIQREDILAGLREVVAAIHAEGGLAGVHVCANTDWGLVLEAGVEIVSFDAYAYFDRLILYRKAIAAFLNAGGILAWGIVPTLSPEELQQATAEALAARLAALIGRVAALGLTPRQVLAQSLVTPSCGMGSLSEALAFKALRLTREISERIRNEDWKDA